VIRFLVTVILPRNVESDAVVVIHNCGFLIVISYCTHIHAQENEIISFISQVSLLANLATTFFLPRHRSYLVFLCCLGLTPMSLVSKSLI